MKIKIISDMKAYHNFTGRILLNAKKKKVYPSKISCMLERLL